MGLVDEVAKKIRQGEVRKVDGAYRASPTGEVLKIRYDPWLRPCRQDRLDLKSRDESIQCFPGFQ